MTNRLSNNSIEHCLIFSYMVPILKVKMYLVRRILKLTVNEFICLCIGILTLVSFIIFWNVPYNIIKKHSDYPVIFWWTKGFPGTSEVKHCDGNIECSILNSDRDDAINYEVNAYLFYGSNIKFEDLPLPRRPHKVIWGLYHEESPRNTGELSHEYVLNLFNFSSTSSRYSDIPFPLQYLETMEDITSTKYFVKTAEKNTALKEISAVMYLQTDCDTATERDDYVKELIKFIDVDSYGACLKNKELPDKFKGDYLNNLNEDDFLNFIARYKFVIAMENGICEDYVTEKFWRPIKVGSVPIYFGSPSIKDWFPNNKSAILLNDFPTPQLLAKHLRQLLANDSLYEEYLEHKIMQKVTNKRIMEELTVHPYQTDALETVHKFECLICSELHRMLDGKPQIHIVNKSHYDCPKPKSALTLNVNPSNSWVSSWEIARDSAKGIYEKVLSNK